MEQNRIDMYVGEHIFKRLVQMLPFRNMLDCFISIKWYDFFQSSSLRLKVVRKILLFLQIEKKRVSEKTVKLLRNKDGKLLKHNKDILTEISHF